MPRKTIDGWQRRLLMATSVLSLSAAFAGFDRPVRAQARQTAPEIAQGAATYDIPAQDLNAALLIFADRAGLQIFYDVQRVRGLRSAVLAGSYTPQQALSTLLTGTGITYRFTGSNTVSLETPSSSDSTAVHVDPLHVQGYSVPPQALIDNLPPPYAGGQVATGGQVGVLGNRDVMDTPFNQTSYTAKKAQDQQAQSIRDVLIDDPSVRTGRPTANFGAQNVTIRGFPSDDASYNGLYGLLPTWVVAAELAERVEVLKGPSAMLNGMPPNSSIGGTVNVVPKRAGDNPLTQIAAGYVSNAQFGGAVDLGRRFGPDKQFGVRVNGVLRAGQTAVQWNAEQLDLVSLGLDYRGDRVRLSADLGYQYQYVNGLVGYVTFNAGLPVPGVSKASSNSGQPWTFSERKDLFAMVRGEFDITERITAYAAFGAHDNRSLFLWSGDLNVVAANGNTVQTPYFNGQYFSTLTGEAGIRGEVDTGPINHAFTFGGSTLVQTIGFGGVNGTAYGSNIYNPTIVAPPNLTAAPVNKISVAQRASLFIADTLSAADKRVQLTVGARLQQVRATNYSGVSGVETSSYDESALTPAIALLFKPWQNVSVYGNFIQGLQPGVIVGPTFTNAGQVLPPYKTTQFEVGVKVDWGKLTTTLSAFQITQPSTIANAVTNTLDLAGEQRNRGLEFNVFGEVASGIRFLGGAMLLDAVMTKTQGGLNDGWKAAGSPDFQFNLSGEWDTPFARGLTLDGRITYTGAQYVGFTTPRLSIPDWARLDLGARYTFDNVRSPTGKPVVIRFNVDNVLDTNYWASVSFNTRLNINTPRTFRLSTSFDF
jgi:iron complex outermembrane recepter protein